jgi:hypothetical protein
VVVVVSARRVAEAAVVADRIETVLDGSGVGASGPGRDAPFARERQAKPMIPTRPNSALERAVDAAGEAWALDWSNTLHGEGRSVSGGWPGTLSEARSRVAACVAKRFGMTRRVSAEELESLTRRAYAAARKAWLARADLAVEE